MTPAKLRLAVAAMASQKTILALCAANWASRSTLYRHASPTGEAQGGSARFFNLRLT